MEAFTVYLYYALSALVIYLVIKVRIPSALDIMSRWHVYLDNTQFSVEEFYHDLSAEIRLREIPHAYLETVTYHQGSIFSPQRQYLRISRNELSFDVCAAHFGTGSFVSWWFGSKRTIFQRLPIIKHWEISKTYYQMDTENMFKESVKNCVAIALDRVSAGIKGQRVLSEIEVGAKKIAQE